ncbi:MAG: HPF/RaiA family ribosome-associated protein [Acidimicrobiales bacterium]
MKIQVNTDHNIDGTEALAAMVEAELRATLRHFEDRLTRIEVHLGDVDGKKTRGDVADKRCLLEARPEGMQPVVATGLGITIEQACRDAARKMQSLLRSTFGRIDARDAGATIRQNELS